MQFTTIFALTANPMFLPWLCIRLIHYCIIFIIATTHYSITKPYVNMQITPTLATMRWIHSPKLRMR